MTKQLFTLIGMFYLLNLFFSKLVMLWHLTLGDSQTMNAVFLFRTPFQIYNPVVTSVSILMVYKWLFSGFGINVSATNR